MSVSQLAFESIVASGDFWRHLTRSVAAIVIYAIIGLALMVLGFFAIDLTTTGKLRQLVKDEKPNASFITAVGLFSMGMIVVTAIYSTLSGDIWGGIVTTLVYGVVGIAAQVVAVRFLEIATGVETNVTLLRDDFDFDSFIIAGAHLGIGLIVAISIL
ncbi:DUF350 domain-containing protein [Segniliparus rugosus]|uniref:DUF350 domain-containing protein n=1 Tax=Segniliparus rugosus (strain ATCC BAA-974 / DSM 45345 / CCUG 50838 / CIP 108380 / JCM 13579 / CDC 945) TaxID=679197 RepID=E5XM82_SEGRC|nr:DUF350 domain-containing protein [Segniliparus rugosus]EFV14546.1 hypothetical protein HMPREF9336_00602 [Segniliparus rugosus ATCC BAA-974]